MAKNCHIAKQTINRTKIFKCYKSLISTVALVNWLILNMLETHQCFLFNVGDINILWKNVLIKHEILRGQLGRKSQILHKTYLTLYLKKIGRILFNAFLIELRISVILELTKIVKFPQK